MIIKKDKEVINELCKEVLGEKPVFFDRMGGLTNRTYYIKLEDEREYVVRIPGEGTEELIIRDNEKKSTELACDIGIDARILYFDEKGFKISNYISGATTMSSDYIKEPHRIKQVADVFKKLHSCGKNTGVPFNVFDMAKDYEGIILSNSVDMYDDYDEIKQEVIKIKEEINKKGVERIVPCHNDPLCENWVVDCNDKMYLIDWEYAGMNDFMWDLSDVSIEAELDQELDEYLLKSYFEKTPTKTIWKHFMANKIFVDYLWTLWAKARVPFDEDPQGMNDWAQERYTRLKNNINDYYKIGENI